MSATVDKFCDNLRDRLNSVEKRLQTAKRNVQSLTNEGERTVRQKCDEFHLKAQVEKDRIERLQGSLRSKAQQKLTETKELISDWKAKNETRKLNARADRAEAYAVDAIDYAVAAISEAEEAIVDAVVARMDADEAQ
jgi:hypothetical protein